MKKTDIAMIILIASVSVGIAYFVASSFFGGMSKEGVPVQTIDPITSVVKSPDSKIFNDDAINPSVEITINGTADAPIVTSTSSSDTTTTAH